MFPFSGMKDSFFGDLHGQGQDSIRFFTETQGRDPEVVLDE